MVAYQGSVNFEHAGSGGLGRMLKKAMTGEGTTLMKMAGSGEVFLADAGAGHPPDLPRERLHHGQRAEPARLRRRHRLGHQARPGRHLARRWPAASTTWSCAGPAGWRSSPTARPCCSTSPSAPTFADAQAAITWSSGVTTSIKTDFKMKNFIGKGSGERSRWRSAARAGCSCSRPRAASPRRRPAAAARRRAREPARRLGGSDVDDVALAGVVARSARSPGTTSAPRAACRSARGAAARRRPPTRAPQSASSRSAPASSRPLSVSS